MVVDQNGQRTVSLISYIQPGGEDDEKYTMTYGGTNAEKQKHLLRTSTTPMGVKQKFDYDVTNGNQTGVATVDDLTSPAMLIKTKTEYTEDGNYPLKSYDARGNAVTKEMNADGTLKCVTDPNEQMVSYEYDEAKRVKKVSTATNGKTYKNEYTYKDDRLETVKHNTTDNDNCDVVYTFGYDELGRKTTVKVGEQVLSTNVYSDDRNGILKEVQYGNGGKVVYEHDDFDRLVGVKYDGEDTARFTYEYGANGQAAFMKDNNLNRTHQTEYDLAERPVQATIRDVDTEELIYRTTLTYDGKNRLKDFAESLPEESHKTSYTYDKDNRTTEIQYDDASHKVNYTYDALGRVVERNAINGDGVYTSGYVFEDGDATLYGTGATTPLVKKITQNGMEFEYVYDERGNIQSETRNGVTTTYEYDALGQLVRVNDPHENAIWEYTYDLGGNITQKQKFARSADGSKGAAVETVNYTYGDSNWKDKLTAHDGVAITYDAIGNPLNDGTWTYEWQAGRQLKKMSKVDNSMTVEFKYNAEGLRVQKKVTEGTTVTTTDYTLHGKLVTHQVVTKVVNGAVTSKDEMHFFYDNASRPAMVEYNGVIYSYVHNLQGDIVGIVDTVGSLVVEYKYDAWGKKLSITGTLATVLGKLNPFRYRGYVYDEESGMYYLRSRYYNPDKCRFINADKAVIARASFKNLFAYCDNKGVMNHDPGGYSFLSAVGSFFKNTVKPSVAKAVSYVKGKASSAWKSTRDFYHHTLAPTSSKIMDSLESIIGGLGVEAGVGFGFGGSAKAGIAEAGALIKSDIFNFSGTIKDSIQFGSMTSMSMSASLGVPGIESLSAGGSISASHFHPIGSAECDCGGILDYSPNCAGIEEEFSTDAVLSLGVSAYFCIGGTLELSYNQTQVLRELQAIW